MLVSDLSIYLSINIYIYVYIYTYIHTYIYIYTPSWIHVSWSCGWASISKHIYVNKSGRGMPTCPTSQISRS